MFRFNEGKLLHELVSKAQRLVIHGLPASMEERFITRTLEVPMLSVKREESNGNLTTEDVENPSNNGETLENVDSQSTTISTTTSITMSETSSVTTIDAISNDTTPANVRELLRVRTAISFITSSYLPSDIAASIEAKLATNDSPVDFAPLAEHLSQLANLRAKVVASRSFGDFSRKRSNLEDEDAAEVRAEKKRKLEEEEKRKKANQSRGVKDLQKVNVSGMKKMSEFFAKKAVPTKAKS